MKTPKEHFKINWPLVSKAGVVSSSLSTSIISDSFSGGTTGGGVEAGVGGASEDPFIIGDDFFWVNSLLGSGPVSSGGPGVSGGVTGVGDDSPDSFLNFFLGGSIKVS